MNSQPSQTPRPVGPFAPRVATRARLADAQRFEAQRLLREFAHDRSATLLLRCDGMIRRAAFGLLRFFGR